MESTIQLKMERGHLLRLQRQDSLFWDFQYWTAWLGCQ